MILTIPLIDPFEEGAPIHSQALSSAIKPFVPPILGVGMLAQFRTIAEVQIGFYLALLASICILIGLYFHRRAYKPLIDSQETDSDAEPGQE